MKELETIEYCFREVAQKYLDRLYEYTSNNGCLLLTADLQQTLNNLFVDYENECHKFPKKSELEIYEKAACLAIAIKNNILYAISDCFQSNIDTYINSLFAINVALKFCESSLDVELFNKFNEYDLSYYFRYITILLVNILECKNVDASIISVNIKKQIDWMTNISKQKIKYLSN